MVIVIDGDFCLVSDGGIMVIGGCWLVIGCLVSNGGMMVAGWVVVGDWWVLVGDRLPSGSCVRVLAGHMPVRVCAHASSCFSCHSTGLAALLQHVRMLRGPWF